MIGNTIGKILILFGIIASQRVTMERIQINSSSANVEYTRLTCSGCSASYRQNH